MKILDKSPINVTSAVMCELTVMRWGDTRTAHHLNVTAVTTNFQDDIPHLKYKIYLNRADVIHRYFFLCLPKNQIAALGKTSVQNVELHCAFLASLNVRCTAKSVLLIESSLSFMVFVSMIGALEVPFFGSQRWALLAKVPVFGPQKMALRVPQSKF